MKVNVYSLNVDMTASTSHIGMALGVRSNSYVYLNNYSMYIVAIIFGKHMILSIIVQYILVGIKKRVCN